MPELMQIVSLNLNEDEADVVLFGMGFLGFALKNPEPFAVFVQQLSPREQYMIINALKMLRAAAAGKSLDETPMAIVNARLQKLAVAAGWRG